MLCERCGNEIRDNATTCPKCGAKNTRASVTPATMYGQFPAGGYAESGQQEYPAYPPQAGAAQVPQQLGSTAQSALAGPPVYAGKPPQAPASTMEYPGITRLTVSNTRTNCLAVEIIFSLIGIFGLGWLMAGEIAAGVILLLCSVLIYWPIMIMGTAFTDGLGLICLGPLAIGSIILNGVLLSGVLRRKAQRMAVMSPPPPPRIPIPPQPQ